MNKKMILGQTGEELACDYLKNKKYKIIERNFRKPWGELDIVAKDRSGVLVFVEVKTLRQFSNLPMPILPEENLTVAKLKKFKKVACSYANFNPELINDKKGWRLDLLAITMPESEFPAGLTNSYKNCDIKHFENVA